EASAADHRAHTPAATVALEPAGAHAGRGQSGPATPIARLPGRIARHSVAPRRARERPQPAFKRAAGPLPGELSHGLRWFGLIATGSRGSGQRLDSRFCTKRARRLHGTTAAIPWSEAQASRAGM